ncbi:gustatory receptor 68a [Ostrinia nubilalis]|uniref:gustatory receptor 68a n=1 Tax=Ostrinia nubilalis TaxID=29057 RepID=UPI00308236A5
MFLQLRKLFSSKNDSFPTLLEIFKPIYVVCRVVGLFPYNVKFKTKHCTIVHRSIYPNSLRAITALLLLFVHNVIQVRDIALIMNEKDSAIVTQINYIVEMVLLVAACITAYCSVYMYRYKIVDILNSLASAWVEHPTTKNSILKDLRAHVRLSLWCLFMLLMLQLSVNFSRKDGVWVMYKVIMIFIYPQMLQFLVIVMYYVLVLMVVALLSNLNAVLETLGSRRIFVGGFRSSETKLTVLDLATIETLFVKVVEIKRNINESFQATILITSMQSFHAIVSEAHIIYHGTLVSRTLNTHEIINFSLWIVFQWIKIYALAHSGDRLKVETLKIGQTLHSIPMEKHDMRSLLETQHFNSLMTYQSTDITVYGYFPLDASLMFQIVASTAMYLIILVQFDKKS